LGFETGLHTAGPAPGRFAPLLPLADWVGFDFKAPFADYRRITGRPQGDRARESLQLLLSSGVACEVRTTWHPVLLSVGDLQEMAQTLADAGCKAWVIQRFRADGCADPLLCSPGIGDVPVGEIAVAGLKISVR
jgi:pyruvate formate lyase activating enzyme